MGGQALEPLKAADRRNLRNDTFDAAIVRGHLENMAAGITGAEDADLCLVDPRPSADVGDRVAVAAPLKRWIDFLSWLSARFAKIDVVILRWRRQKFANELYPLGELDFWDLPAWRWLLPSAPAHGAFPIALTEFRYRMS